jgi:DNA-binding Lrp family transcriptional regulator
LRVDARKLRAITRQDVDLGWRIIQALAQRQQAIEFDVSGYHYAMTGTQRLLDYLVELAGETTVTLKPSKKIIASHLGMSPETFSRSLRLLSESGVIVVEGRHVHIQNAALLNTEIGNERQLVSFPRKPKHGSAKEDSTLSPGALINLCGRQRVLSQRMAIAWGLVGRNIALVKSRVKLRQFEIQFERNLSHLNRLDLPSVLADRLTVLKDAWQLYRQALFEAEPALRWCAGGAGFERRAFARN